MATEARRTVGGDSPLSAKPDWPAAQKRIIAFWDRSAADRPCMDVKASKPCDAPWPTAPENLADRYFDAEYLAAFWGRWVDGTYFGGDAVPSGGFFMGGYALGCGPDVIFAPNTVWHPHLMKSLDEPLPWKPGPGCPWRAKLTAAMNRLLDVAAGRFLVGHTMQVPLNDLVMLLRGADDFLAEMADGMDKCVLRLREGLAPQFELLEHFRGVVEARQAGCVWGWPGLWHPKYVLPTQSDMSCMISTEMFDRYVMTEIDAMGERYGLVWYHLDGPGAIRHLPTLLSRPYMRAIQYVPGAGVEQNGPAWMDLYRRVQSAGRCLDLDCPLENVEFLCRHLRPEGLVLRVWGLATPEQADEMVANSVKWCGTHVNT